MKETIFKSREFLIILTIILTLICIFDVISTYISLNSEVIYVVEANPFMRYSMEIMGILPSLIIYKAIFLLVLFIGYYRINIKKIPIMIKFMIPINVFYIAAMFIFNYKILMKTLV